MGKHNTYGLVLQAGGYRGEVNGPVVLSNDSLRRPSTMSCKVPIKPQLASRFLAKHLDFDELKEKRFGHDSKNQVIVLWCDYNASAYQWNCPKFLSPMEPST